MSQVRAIQVTGGIAIEGPNEDDEYENRRAREDAAGEPTEAPRCRYVAGKTCNCGGRWTCLPVAA